MNAPEQKPDGLSGELVKILSQCRQRRNRKGRDSMIFQRQHGQLIRYPDSVAGKPEEQMRCISLACGKDGVRLFPYDIVRDCIQIIGRSLLLVERACGDSFFTAEFMECFYPVFCIQVVAQRRRYECNAAASFVVQLFQSQRDSLLFIGSHLTDALARIGSRIQYDQRRGVFLRPLFFQPGGPYDGDDSRIDMILQNFQIAVGDDLSVKLICGKFFHERGEKEAGVTFKFKSGNDDGDQFLIVLRQLVVVFLRQRDDASPESLGDIRMIGQCAQNRRGGNSQLLCQ